MKKNGKPPWRAKKLIHFLNKIAHSLETPRGSHNKNVTLLEILLLKNFLDCHPKIEKVHTQKVAPEKHRFAVNKEA